MIIHANLPLMATAGNWLLTGWQLANMQPDATQFAPQLATDLTYKPTKGEHQ